MLTHNEELILLDLASYIIWSIKQNNGFYTVLGNVGHDCIGLQNHEECFVPRTNNYQNALLSDFNVKVGG